MTAHCSALPVLYIVVLNFQMRLVAPEFGRWSLVDRVSIELISVFVRPDPHDSESVAVLGKLFPGKSDRLAYREIPWGIHDDVREVHSDLAGNVLGSDHS